MIDTQNVFLIILCCSMYFVVALWTNISLNVIFFLQSRRLEFVNITFLNNVIWIVNNKNIIIKLYLLCFYITN